LEGEEKFGYIETCGGEGNGWGAEGSENRKKRVLSDSSGFDQLAVEEVDRNAGMGFDDQGGHRIALENQKTHTAQEI
jgi:hypothetical protein